MSQFFVKKGVITSDVSKTVKVSFAPGKNPRKLSAEPEVPVKQPEPEENRESLLAKRVYDFSQRLKTDDERLEELLAQGKKKLSPEKTEAVLPDELAQIYTKAGRMLSKLGGYSGGGLGANNQGIVEFIKPERRVKFGQVPSDEQPGKSRERKAKDLNSKEKDMLQAVHKWRKGFGYTTQASKYNQETDLEKENDDLSDQEGTIRFERDSKMSYKSKVTFRPSAEINLKGAHESQGGAYKIIDMTKPQARMMVSMKEAFQSSESLKAMQQSKVSSERCNARFLLERLKESHLACVSAQRAKENQTVSATKAIALRSDELVKCEHDLEQISNKKEELSLIQASLRRVAEYPLQPDCLNQIMKEFVGLQKVSASLASKYHLSQLMLKKVTAVYSQNYRGAKGILSDWSKDGMLLVVEVLKMHYKITEKDALRLVDKDLEGHKVKESFRYDLEFFVTRCILPGMMNFTANEWDHEDPEELIDVFCALEKIFPAQIFYDFFDNVIIKVLVKKIDRWEMDESLLYPHVWIQPWMEILERDPSHRVNAVFDKLKKKFRSILTTWTPADKYAAKLLLPWKDILPKPIWDDFLYLDILPKVIFNLESFEANPLQMNLDPLSFFVEWSAFVPSELADDLIQEYVSPKIEAVLKVWKQADQSELMEWIEGWVIFFDKASEEVQESVKEALMALVIKYCPASS